MMKTATLTILIIVFSCLNAEACKCIVPNPSIIESIRNSDVIFIGRCISGEFIEKGEISDPKNYSYTIVWKFKLQKALKGTHGSKIVEVETGMGFGDCGFPFKIGMSYLIYSDISENLLETSICSRTKIIGLYPNRVDAVFENEISEIEKLSNQTK